MRHYTAVLGSRFLVLGWVLGSGFEELFLVPRPFCVLKTLNLERAF
jgi:hypothetical protein